MNKILLFSIATLAALWSTPSFALLQIHCDVPEEGKVVTVTHPASPGNTSADQGPAAYEVHNTKGVLLGSGEFAQSQFMFHDFLNMVVFEFMSESASVGVALDKVSLGSLDELKPGQYTAKSDLFVAYGEGPEDSVDGNTLDCTLTFQ